jgi:hypothetical protein
LNRWNDEQGYYWYGGSKMSPKVRRILVFSLSFMFLGIVFFVFLERGVISSSTLPGDHLQRLENRLSGIINGLIKSCDLIRAKIDHPKVALLWN